MNGGLLDAHDIGNSLLASQDVFGALKRGEANFAHVDSLIGIPIDLSIGSPIEQLNRRSYRFGGMDTVGKRVKWARLQIKPHMSGGKLARLIGMSQPALFQLEKGDSKSSTHLVKIAEILGVSAKWLYDGTGHHKDGVKGSAEIEKFERLSTDAQRRALAVNDAIEVSQKKQ